MHSQVYIGSDKVALEALREGLDGNVSSGGGSAVLPEVVAMVGATGRGDTRAADSAFAAVTFWCAQGPSSSGTSHPIEHLAFGKLARILSHALHSITWLGWVLEDSLV